MDWVKIVTLAGYEEKANCVATVLESNNINTLLQLENSTGKLGHICDTDIYSLVAAVRKVFSEGIPVEEVGSAGQNSEEDTEEVLDDEVSESSSQNEYNGEEE